MVCPLITLHTSMLLNVHQNMKTEIGSVITADRAKLVIFNNLNQAMSTE